MINLYPLQKTLCFELKPIGMTLDNFKKNNIRENAEARANEFKQIKHFLDEIHIEIMESGLKKLANNSEFIECLKLHDTYRGYYIESCKKLSEQKKELSEHKKLANYNKEAEKQFKEQQKIVDEQQNTVDNNKQKKEDNDKKLLELVTNSLESDYRYQDIFSEKKIDILKEHYKNDSEKIKLINHFSEFISYFNKYDSRIKNLYGDKKIATTYKSIAYRLITDNLPIFHANTEKIKYIKKRTKSISFDINLETIENFANYLTIEDINKYNKEVDKINSKVDKVNIEIDKINIKNNKNLKRCSYLGKLYLLVDLDQDADILKRISDDKELVEIINEFLNRVHLQNEEDIKKFKNIFSNLKDYDLKTTFIKNSKFLDGVFTNIKIKSGFKQSYISFDDIIHYEKWNDKNREQNINTFFSEISNLADKLFAGYEEKYRQAKDILTSNYEVNEKKLARTEDNKSNNDLVKIKGLLESIKLLSTFVSWFVPKVKANKDYTNFFKVNFKIYNELTPERLAKVDQIYSHVRAYFSLKNFSTKKFRVNFESPNCLNNWNLKDIKKNLGTIFKRKENGKTNYYLGIINKDKFSEFPYTKGLDDVYEQVIYKKDSESDFSMDFKNISKQAINEMVEKDELYLFQIYNQDFSEYSRGNVKMHTKYWNNIFSNENVDENLKLKRFFINGDAQLFYRPKSLERKITHPQGQDIKNKNKSNSKETSNFKYDLIKDKRYTEDKFLFHVPITINDEYECELTKNKKEKKSIQELLNKKILNKIQSGKILNIIGISRSADDLLRATVIDLNGDVKESISLSTIKSECFDKENKKRTFEQNYNKLLNEKEIERSKANNANNNNKSVSIQKIGTDENVIKEWQSERSIKDFKNGYISQAVNEIAKLFVKYNAIVVFEDLEAKSERVDAKIEKSMYEKLEKALVTKLSFLVLDKKLLPKQPGSSFNAYQLTYYEEKEKHRTEGKKSDVKQNGIIFYIPTNLTSNIDPNTGFINCFSIPRDIDDIKDFIEKFSDIKKISDDKEHYEFAIFYKSFGEIDKNSDDRIKSIFLRKNLVKNIYDKLLNKFLEKKWIIYSNGEFLFEKELSKQTLEELNLVNERWEKVFEEEYDSLGIGYKKYTYKKVNLKDEFGKLFENYKSIEPVKKEKIVNFIKKDSNSITNNRYPIGRGMANLLKNQKQKVDPKENFVREFVRLFQLILQMRNYNKEKDYEYIISPVVDENNQFFTSKADEIVSKNIALKGLLLVNKIKKNDEKLQVTDKDWISYILGKKFPIDNPEKKNYKNKSNDKKKFTNQSVKNKDSKKQDEDEINDSNWFNYIEDNKNKKY